MKRFFISALAAAVLGLAGAPAASAQTADYSGPRFPGGPDSLRALVYRATRQAGAGTAGRVLMHFDLKNGQQPYNFKLVPSPGSLNMALVEASTNAMAYLEAKMRMMSRRLPWFSTSPPR